MKRLFATTLAAGALLASASSANAWESPVFRSPTGNIGCAAVNLYDSQGLQVTCWTRNDGAWVAVGQRGAGRYGYDDVVGVRGPVLKYGQTWTAGRNLVCTSRSDGMRCRNKRTGHGFFIARSDWYVY